MKCSKCRQDIGGMDHRAAFICVEVMGDEYIYSYWHCEKCEVYTSETYHDRFLGEGSVRTSDPIPKDEGDRIVRLIKRCPDPANKRCNCKSHKHFM